MEIYTLYDTFVSMFDVVYRSNERTLDPRAFLTSLLLAVAIWAVLFVLQGIGLYTMAKKRDMQKEWLAFVPFVNLWYIGKLAGNCTIFGRKMKHAGLYTMIAQIFAFIVCAATIAIEIYLFTGAGCLVQRNDYGSYTMSGFSGFGVYAYKYYCLSSFFVSIFQLIYIILLFVLLTALYKKYYTKGYLFISWLALFIPLSRYIVIFVLRNNRAVDYDAYVRAQREAFLRRQQQMRNPYGQNPYNPYGQNPYGQNPYGQNPYGQNPYDQNPYGQNPYGQGTNANAPQNGGGEDPFSEFATGSASSSDKSYSNNDGTRENGGTDSDDLFN